MRKFFLVLLLIFIFHNYQAKCQSQAFIVYSDSIVHKMKGGLGASWHSISEIGPLENQKYKYPVRDENTLGSAWGGNPPLQNQDAWRQLCDHARWLGLDFIRVELIMKMYEPRKGQFDWESKDMLALYKILDYCQLAGADVFLQQMAIGVDWNTYPGVHPLLSAPYSLKEYSEGIASLLEHLTKVKKYTCIKYFCITNEPPGGTWGYWWSTGPEDAPFAPALKMVSEELMKKNIKVPVSGPDWTSLPPFNNNISRLDPFLGSYDIHSYDGISGNGSNTVRQWIQWAHSKNKPFFISEFGNMNLGWGKNNPGPKSLNAALSNAHDIITALSLGADGMNRWSFVNRGDMDGQWQLVRTWDIQKKEYLNKVSPENAAYCGYAMFTRFIAKYASILKTVSSRQDSTTSVLSLKNPDGNLVYIFLNQSPEQKNISVRIESAGQPKKLYKYVYNNKIPEEGSFALNPVDSLPKASLYNILLEGRSITVLTSNFLKNNDQGIIK